jgi:hypothetical protein
MYTMGEATLAPPWGLPGLCRYTVQLEGCQLQVDKAVEARQRKDIHQAMK